MMTLTRHNAPFLAHSAAPAQIQTFACRRALRRNGTYLSAQCHTAAAVALNGQVETAEDMVRQMLDTRPDLTLALIEERFMARFPQQAQEALLRGLRLAGLK